jgi:predicted ATPase
MNEQLKIKTAIDFIKESNLFNNDKYSLLQPLMKKVLDNTISKEDVDKFIDSIAPLDKRSEPEQENLEQSIKKSIESPIQKEVFKIKTIKEIKSVEDVGLIDKIESVKLGDKINIFYGLNASGKTSFYKAICSTLGYEKETLANINKNTNIPKCRLMVEDTESKTQEIEWQRGKINPKLNVKIFDPDIFLSLVKDDQDNTFSLAHLKQECFQLLSEFLEDLESCLNDRKRSFSDSLQLRSPSLFGEIQELKEDSINKIEITKEEKEDLDSLTKKYEEIQKINFGDKITILSNLIDKIEEILEILGKKIMVENKAIWKYLLTFEYFEKIKELIKDYVSSKKILEDQQSTQLKYYILENWLKNDKWKNFINSSFDFIKTLPETEQKKYLQEECPYCHQELLEKAKKLIESYKILQGEIKEKTDKINKNLDDYANNFSRVINELNNISEKEKVIDEKIKEFSIVSVKTYDKNFIINLFIKLKTVIINKDELKYSQEDIKKISNLFDYYSFICEKILQKKKEYEDNNKNKEENLKKIEGGMQSLKRKNEIVNNKGCLLKYIKLCNILNLTLDIKTYISRLGTDFSKEVFIGEFEKYLDKEYERLNFNKPLKYQLSTRTTYGENKRVYRIGDKKIKEIFSEGEQKQHALADFFAQSEIENFEGVFILDDPVTSLDECNMEYLSERIVILANERNNQIIIFTHNLVFLNYLLELIDEEKVKHFIRTNSTIFLDPDAKLGTDHDLKVKRDEINDRIKLLEEKEKSCIKINEYEIRNVYDLLSGYLESIVEIKIFKSVISRYRPNIRMNSLNKIEWGNNIISDVIHLYSKTSRKGSRHSQPIGIQTPTLAGLLTDKKDIDNLVSKI